jgi:hypothetical protein
MQKRKRGTELKSDLSTGLKRVGVAVTSLASDSKVLGSSFDQVDSCLY